MRSTDPDPVRRRLLQGSLATLGLLAAGPVLARPNQSGARLAVPEKPGQPAPRLHELGPLMEPDENGIRLPEGFSSRVVAVADEKPVAGVNTTWHRLPDGGACYAASDGGWIYVSNSEHIYGGASALRFSAEGDVIDVYPILRDTKLNCAGGATPWGTWLSCEEHSRGLVHECDPSGQKSALPRPAMGRFTHEACAVDPQKKRIYLTEDLPDGGLYRFTPAEYPNLETGVLEVACVDSGEPRSGSTVRWRAVDGDVPAHQVVDNPLRRVHADTARFEGGEGIWWHAAVVFFSTKWDNRVWAYDTDSEKLAVVYDAADYADPVLTGVDNLAANAAGELIVAEDDGDMQLVVLGPDYQPRPLLQVVGQSDSELAGQFFSPDGGRLYFSSQRGPSKDGHWGITYEISGPFIAAG